MRYIILAVIVVLIIGITACTRRSKMYTEISPEQAKKMQDQGNLIIDVREPDEYAAGHIEAAVNVPLSSLESGIISVAPAKDTTLLIHCQSGRRSKIAADMLVKMGYTNIYEFGGIIDWPYGVVQD